MFYFQVQLIQTFINYLPKKLTFFVLSKVHSMEAGGLLSISHTIVTELPGSAWTFFGRLLNWGLSA